MPASSAPIDTTLIKMESAVKFRELASSSTFKKESAKNATKDTQSSMEGAKKSTSPLTPMKDAPSGPMESAKPAPRDGTSMLMEFALPSATSAPPGMKNQEPALPATTDPLLLTGTVLLMSTPVLFPKATFSAKPGTKKTVSLVPIEAFSMPMVSAFQSAPNVTPSIRPQETA